MAVIIGSSSSVCIRSVQSNYMFFCDKILRWWGSKVICVYFPILAIDNFFVKIALDVQSVCTKG